MARLVLVTGGIFIDRVFGIVTKRTICHPRAGQRKDGQPREDGRPREIEDTFAEIARVGGAVRVRFDGDALGVELPDGVTLATCTETPSYPIEPATQIAFDAWLSGPTCETGSLQAAGALQTPGALQRSGALQTAGALEIAESVSLGVVFVWPQLGGVEAVAQQRGLLQHVMSRSHGRGYTRIRVWQFDMDRASWANAKRDALWALGEYGDTKSLAVSLLACDPGTRYDTSLVYFFAPYRLRRSQATIIREERHSFRDVAETREGAAVRRHIAMVRLASPEAIVSDVA